MATHRSRQLRHLGSADQARGRAVPARRARTRSATRTRPAGASAARRCTTSPTSRAFCPPTSRSRAITAGHWIGRSSTPTWRPITTRSRPRSACRATPRRRKSGGRAGAPYPMPPMKTFRHGEVWLKGFEANGIRMVPDPVAMNSTKYKGRRCLHLRWLVPCRLSDRRTRQSGRHVSRRRAQSRRRGASRFRR